MRWSKPYLQNSLNFLLMNVVTGSVCNTFGMLKLMHKLIAPLSTKRPTCVNDQNSDSEPENISVARTSTPVKATIATNSKTTPVNSRNRYFLGLVGQINYEIVSSSRCILSQRICNVTDQFRSLTYAY